MAWFPVAIGDAFGRALAFEGANEIEKLGQKSVSRECGCMFVIVARMSGAISGILSKFPHVAEPVIGRAFARPGGSCGLRRRPRCHCITAPESLITLPHFSVSARRNAPNAAPDSDPGSAPTSESFRAKSGSASALV